VLGFVDQAHIEPGITTEVFIVDRRVEGFGAVE
jgi:hypothetical protein